MPVVKNSGGCDCLAPFIGRSRVPNYLLPCECSCDVTVGTADAGGTVVCPDCGRTLAVPKLRDLGKLREARAAARATRRRWTAGHSAVLVGLLLAATAGLASRLFQPPPAPVVDVDELRRRLTATSYANIYGIWKTEIERRSIALPPSPEEEMFRRKSAEAAEWRRRLGYLAAGALALAVTGGLAVVLRNAAARSRGGGE